MNVICEDIKTMVAEATTENLVEAYKNMDVNEETEVYELLVKNAIEAELEERNVIEFNEETWEYDFI